MSGERLTKQALDDIDKFNGAIMSIVRIAEQIEPDNSTIQTTKRLLGLAISEAPSIPIKMAGYYIRKYKDQIKNKNEDFFLSGQINHELSIATKEFADAFGLITSRWRTLSQKDKDRSWAKIDIMYECAMRTVIPY